MFKMWYMSYRYYKFKDITDILDRGRRGAVAQACDCKHEDCGFDSHSKK